MPVKQGSIVLVDFSHSNLKETKYRPALVISSSKYNETVIDVVVLSVTIYAVEKEIIRKIVAQLKEEKIKEIKTQLLELFS
ncbi:PemK-like, MazF-like toxin of type II toxin-antitoxin system [uncultured archaeon]|nr:PemK-like, MazF-like toxin of type II toxin-antitoxin system [uncultured archaeon]